MRIRILALLAAMALLSLSAGCEKGNGSSTASRGPQDFPVTVNGIAIKAAPQKVVVLAPSLMEIVYDLGYTAAGRSEECDAPAAVTALPSAGRMLLPDIDAIRSVGADLVLTQTALSEQAKALLDKADIPVLVVPAAGTFEEVAAEYEAVGRALGGAETGLAAAKAVVKDSLIAGLDAITAKVADREPPAVLYVASGDGSVATGDTVIDRLLTTAGAANAAHDGTAWKLPDGAGAKAQAIFCPAALMTAVKGMAAFKDSPAVKTGKIYGIDAAMVERHGLRMVEAAQAISQRLFPDAYATAAPTTTVPSGTGTTAADKPSI